MLGDAPVRFELDKDPALCAWEQEFLQGNQLGKVLPMDREMTMVFMMLSLDEASKGRGGSTAFPLSHSSFQAPLAQIMRSRLAMMGVAITPQALLFLMVQSKGSPGTAVMYSQAMHRLFVDNGRQQITIEHLAQAFPVGFPTEERLSQMWEAQKHPQAPLGNMLDGVILPSPNRPAQEVK